MQPVLYTVIEKKKLHELLETFHQCIGLSVQVLDETGKFWMPSEMPTLTVRFSNIFFPKASLAPNFIPMLASLP